MMFYYRVIKDLHPLHAIIYCVVHLDFKGAFSILHFWLHPDSWKQGL